MKKAILIVIAGLALTSCAPRYVEIVQKDNCTVYANMSDPNNDYFVKCIK